MPSKHKMQFFTPELYRRFNSQDEQAALAADRDWEAAIDRYHQHLAKLDEQMPARVIELSRLSLHDGEILYRQEQQDPLSFGHSPLPVWPWCGLATVAVRLDDEVVTLFYVLRDHLAEQPAPEDWPFSKMREHWLYDEVHSQRDHGFTHLILVSSGVVLTIPFSTVSISRFRLGGVTGKSGKQSA